MKLHASAALLLLAAACTQNKEDTKAPSEPGVAAQGGGAGPGTAMAALPAAASPAGGTRMDPSRVVARWEGGQLTYGQLHAANKQEFDKLQKKYMSDVYALEQQSLEKHLMEELVGKAAKAVNKAPEQYMQDLAVVAPPSDEEVKAFYEKNVKNSGHTFDAVKDQIVGFMQNNKRREAVQAEYQKLLKASKVQKDLQPPEEALAKFDLAGRPMIGNPEAKVTIVEFSDFQCPYCANAAPEIKRVIDAYPKDVKVYFLHFPLNFHESARPAAIASHCAHKQGKFWPMHDKLFQNQQKLSPDNYLAYAKEVGLDVEQFKTCQADPAAGALVDADMKQGEAAGVGGTPSFYINGIPYSQGIPTPEAVASYVSGS